MTSHCPATHQPPHRALRDAPPSPQRELAVPQRQHDPKPEAQGGGRWICATCGAEVTRGEAAIEVGGSHAHTFLNPDGIVFRIVCFRHAAGAVSVGPESTYWTWFPGFAWRSALCRACVSHLGWSFRDASSSFVALILERMIYEERREPPA